MPTFIPLTDPERDDLLRLIASGEPLPESWRGRLFPDSPHAIEIGKEYQLVYEGLSRKPFTVLNICAIVILENSLRSQRHSHEYPFEYRVD